MRCPRPPSQDVHTDVHMNTCLAWQHLCGRPPTMGVRTVLVLCVAARARADDVANETECRGLGFGLLLLCSSCTKLGEFVGDADPLVGECKGCCKEEADHAGVVYASAVLDVCR